MKLPAALVGAALAALLASPSADASLTVSPSRTVLSGRPGKVLKGFYTVQNNSDEPMEVKVEAEDWTSGITAERRPAPWLKAKPDKLVLPSGKKARIKYTIRIPDDAVGELRTQVFFTTAVAGATAPMRSRLGTIIYVGIEGTERIALAVSKVDVVYSPTTPGVDAPDRLEIIATVSNTGNAHIVPEGAVIIRDPQGRQVADLPIQSGWGLLPNQQDAYRAIGQGVALPPGKYNIEVYVTGGGDLRRPTTVKGRSSFELHPDWRIDVAPYEHQPEPYVHPADAPPAHANPPSAS